MRDNIKILEVLRSEEIKNIYFDICMLEFRLIYIKNIIVKKYNDFIFDIPKTYLCDDILENIFNENNKSNFYKYVDLLEYDDYRKCQAYLKELLLKDNIKIDEYCDDDDDIITIVNKEIDYLYGEIIKILNKKANTSYSEKITTQLKSYINNKIK